MQEDFTKGGLENGCIRRLWSGSKFAKMMGWKSFAGCQRMFKPGILTFSIGCGVGWVLASMHMTDPNQGWDPQAASGLLCDRDEIKRAGGGAHGWSAVAYYQSCGLIGSSSAIYIYLLQSDQTLSPATLVVSYDGPYVQDEPQLEWRDSTTLVVHAHMSEIYKQVIQVGGIVIEYPAVDTIR